jgi:Domain of unknown function (DUF4184)
MPLTIAHPAAVMPLRKSGLPLSALVIGSMAPDLEYFFHLAPIGHFGHTFNGLFFFCVPVSLLCLFLGHRIWFPPANALLNRTATEFRFLPVSRLMLICFAILFGAFTHVVWDSFTHSFGWMVMRVPLLRMPIAETPWGTFRLFKVLQHTSTALGLVVLATVSFASLQRGGTKVWMTLTLLVGTSVAGGLIIGVLKAGMPSSFETARVLIGISIVGSFVVFTAETTLVGVIWRGRRTT